MIFNELLEYMLDNVDSILRLEDKVFHSCCLLYDYFNGDGVVIHMALYKVLNGCGISN